MPFNGTYTAVGADAVTQLNNWLTEFDLKKVLMISDINTQPLCRRVTDCLTAAETELFSFPDPSLTPDENAVGRLFLALDSQQSGKDSYDVLVAVGSGTLNDLTRYVAHRLKLPYFVVATAPSMDGYASALSALIVSSMKQTYTAAAPVGIIGDTKILSAAPSFLKAAGYGDIAGKHISLNDWALGHTVWGEFYDEALAAQTRQALEACEALSGLDDPNASETLFHALLKSGEVMGMLGNSRPASGSEHHLSHFWEMRKLLRGEAPALHGAKVGVATLVMLKINEWLVNEPVDWANAYEQAARFDPKTWRQTIREVYGGAAAGILRLWPDESADLRLNRIDACRAKWENIQALCRHLPSFAALEERLRHMGCPVSPADLSISRSDFVAGVCHAHRVRTRFTALQIADVLGLLPGFAERLANHFISR